MPFTRKEEQLILRRRTWWHRVLRYTWYTVSTLSVVILVTYGVFVYGKLQEQLAYQDVINAIPASAHVGGPPVFTFLVDQYARGAIGSSQESRLVADQLQLYQQTLDSLGLSSKVLGFNLTIRVVPFHSFGWRRGTSWLGVYSTDCGCERDTLDYTVLEIDSSATNVGVATSHLVASANIQP